MVVINIIIYINIHIYLFIYVYIYSTIDLFFGNFCIVSLLLFCFPFRKKPGSFDKNDFELLAPVLDGFSLMTYDYSSQGRWVIVSAVRNFIGLGAVLPLGRSLRHVCHFFVLCSYHFSSFVTYYWETQGNIINSLNTIIFNLPYCFLCRPGPNAPLQWMKDCVLTLSPEKGKQRSKILMGLNFYGQEFAATGSGRKSKQEKDKLKHSKYAPETKWFSSLPLENILNGGTDRTLEIKSKLIFESCPQMCLKFR